MPKCLANWMLFRASLSEAIPARRQIYTSTKALLFLGTPHRGTDWAGWGEIATAVAKLFFDTNSASIKHLKVNGDALVQLQSNFENLNF